jgi:type II secretory ATPase GspE/PulE/Tfp pilus assembly ATPase PilB-like protein
LIVDKDIREKLITAGNESEIRVIARERGYGGLLESGVSKLLGGLTTAEEVLRVTFAEDAKA